MQYNGKELKEYISEEPIFFDPPKRMLCWNRDTDIPIECLAFSYDNRSNMPVVAALEEDKAQAWRHCAEIPEEYYAVVAVEHRAVYGVNRYALGKFPSRQDAQLAMLKMIGLLGGDPVKGSQDMYVAPFDAVRGLPNPVHDERCDSDTIPRYLVNAYDEAMKKFLGEEDTGRPRIEDLRENVGIAQKMETPRLESFKEQAAEELAREDSARDAESRTLKNKMVAELVYNTGWGVYHCMKALQACGWKPVAAERMLKEKFKDFASNK